jgi:hypothetical protein
MLYPYVGGEVAFIKPGTVDFNGTLSEPGRTVTDVGSIDLWGIKATLLGAYPIIKQVSVFAEFGINLWHVSEKRTFDRTNIDGSAFGTGPVFGLGGLFNPFAELDLRVSWEIFPNVGDAVDTEQAHLNMFWASILFSFDLSDDSD